MTNALKIAGGVAIALLLLDVLGFIAWAMSGQFPADDFFIGSITTHILRAIVL